MGKDHLIDRQGDKMIMLVEILVKIGGGCGCQPSVLACGRWYSKAATALRTVRQLTVISR